MNNKITIKIEPSVSWNNPYKNGFYMKIDIVITNHTPNEISINSIDIVCAGNNYPIDKTLLVSYISADTEQSIEENTIIYEHLKLRGFISNDFYLLIKHSVGESISNTINLSTKSTCA